MVARGGELVHLPTPVNCSNLAMAVGLARLRLREIKINDNTQEPDDYKELGALLADGVFAKGKEVMPVGQQSLQLKLQADQAAVHASLEEFVRDKNLDFTRVSAEGLTSMTWLGVLTITLLVLFSYVGCRVVKARAAIRKGRAVRTDEDSTAM